MFRYLVRRVGVDEADPLLGEVFRVAFEKPATYDCERPNARPWLYGIATNLLRRHQRSEVRRSNAVTRLSARQRPDDDPADDVAATIDAEELWPHVVEAIGRLPEGERDALLLYVWEELSYDDIAAALDVPVGTVRSRLNRARVTLRELQPVTFDEVPEPAVFTREKERLRSAISDKQLEAAKRMPDVYARLAYDDERAALEYLVRVFQLEEIREARTDFGDNMLAWLRVGDGVVMIGRANADVHRIHSPRELGNTTVQMMVYVHDVDAHYRHAVADRRDHDANRGRVLRRATLRSDRSRGTSLALCRALRRHQGACVRLVRLIERGSWATPVVSPRRSFLSRPRSRPAGRALPLRGEGHTRSRPRDC